MDTGGGDKGAQKRIRNYELRIRIIKNSMSIEQPDLNSIEKSPDKVDEEKEVEFDMAKPEESRGIYEVKKASWLATYTAPEYGLTKEDVESKNFFKKVEKLKGRLESGEYQTWVIKAEGKIVGYCTGGKGEEFNRIQAFHILPEFQGKGYGSKLLESAISWLGGEKPILVGVASLNERAIHVYEKFGFVKNPNPTETVMERFSNGKEIQETEMIIYPKNKEAER